jgi:NADPH2:quinone reductase
MRRNVTVPTVDSSDMTTARSIVMRALGGPDVLRLERVTLASLAPGEVRLRALASAVNHSDLDIRVGNSTIRRTQPFPYVPGLEVVGEVVEVAADVESFIVGQRAWTAMQGLGGVRAVRDGGYAELVTVSASVLAPLAGDLDAVRFAATGLAGVTALEAMRRLGDLRDKTLVVTGTTGGVGSVAVQIGRALGAKVVGLDRNSAPPAPGSADAILDVVGGAMFPHLVAALRPHARYCAVGASASAAVALDLWSLLDGRSLTGYSSEDLDGEALRRATRELLAMNLAPPPTTVMPLADAARAHELLESRAVRGRIVLVP